MSVWIEHGATAARLTTEITQGQITIATKTILTIAFAKLTICAVRPEMLLCADGRRNQFHVDLCSVCSVLQEMISSAAKIGCSISMQNMVAYNVIATRSYP